MLRHLSVLFALLALAASPVQAQVQPSAPVASRSYVDTRVQTLLDALSGKADKASPTFTGTVSVPVLAITGTDSSGNVSGMTVNPSASAGANTLARLLADLAAASGNGGAGKADLASPTFTGVVTVPTLKLTNADSTGNVSAMSVTPDSAAASGTLAKLFSDQAAAVAAKANTASPTFTGTVTTPRLAVMGSTSTGDVSGMSVTPASGAAANTLAKLLSDQNTSIAAKANTASPTFTGTVTTPKLAVTGNLSTGEISAMTVVPNSGAADGTLAKLIGDRALLASPSFSGTVTVPVLAISGAGSTGAVGTMSVVPGNTSIALNTYLAQPRNVRGYGALGDDSDQTAAFKAAVSAQGSGLLSIPNGIHRTDGSVPFSNVAMEWDAPQINGGYIPGVQDVAAANLSVKLLSINYGTRFSYGNVVMSNNPVTNSAASYEHSNFYSRIQQLDSSDYANNRLRDAVNYEMQGTITGGTKTGRLWGTSGFMTVDNGSDGYVVFHEFGIINNATASAGEVGTITAKFGISALIYGSAPVDGTAGLYMGGTGKWRDGIWADARTFDRYFFQLNSAGTVLASMDPAGNLIAPTLRATGALFSGGAATFGSTINVAGSATISGAITGAFNLDGFTYGGAGQTYIGANCTGGGNGGCVVGVGGGLELFGAPASSALSSRTPGILIGADRKVTLGGALTAGALPASGGTVRGTLCIDTAGSVYVKTTSGACL